MISSVLSRSISTTVVRAATSILVKPQKGNLGERVVSHSLKNMVNQQPLPPECTAVKRLQAFSVSIYKVT